MLHNLKIQAHLLHMCYLVYKSHLVAAMKNAHVEMHDYRNSLAELVARNIADLD